MSITVTSISVYPVKSTATLSLEQANVLAAGLEHDRRWMLVDEQGEFLSGREHPGPIRIHVTPKNGGLLLAAAATEPMTVRDASGLGDPLGVNLIPRNQGTVSLGDPVTVLA